MKGSDQETTLPDAGTVQLLQRTAVAAAGAKDKVQVIDLPREPPGTYAIVGPDGSYQIKRGDAPDRLHRLSSIGEVGDFVTYAKDKLSAEPVVWIGRGEIIVLLDGERRNRAVCPIRKTEQWRWVADQAAQAEFDQRKFIRLLRVFLADCIDESGQEAIRILRSIDFRESTAGHGTVERGRESMGRDIEAEVRSAAGELPEAMTLSMRPIDDAAIGRRWDVKCALEINAREATFQLIPMAGQIEQVRDAALDRVHEVIEGATDVPIFFGAPEGEDGKF